MQTQTPTLVAHPAPRSASWKEIVARHQEPHRGRALWQVFNSFGAYVAVWGLIYLTLGISWWITVPLAALAGALMVRVFIIFHDCGHGSFFRSRRANDVVGFFAGVLTFTPYYHWRWEHSQHHASSGKLDRRGMGDVWTLTVQEYLESSRWRRFAYRLARNPVVLFLIAPLLVFVVWQRLPKKQASRRERHSVWWMNLALVGLAAGLISIFGLVPYLVIQFTAMGVAGAAGVWLFYVQHQFEDAYWERGDDWDYVRAALQGSSFYKLPRVLQWFSGNIGFHHIHHLSPRIPNYNLEACHRSDPLFSEVKPLTLRASLRTMTLFLWDESSGKLISARAMRRLRRMREATGTPELRSGSAWMSGGERG